MKSDAVPLVDRIALAAILLTAGARAMIAFSPVPVFDLDPAIDGSAFVGATPARSVLMDALALAGACWLLVRSFSAGSVRDWRRTMIALFCLPAVIVAVSHGIGDADQLWRGSTWTVGAASAVALVLYRSAGWTRLLGRAAIAALGGIAVVIAVRGLAQMTAEHGATVAYYNATRDTFLRAQGWLANSPQALSYERRLMQNEASGWFGFANVFATVSAGSAVMLANIAIGRGLAVVRAWVWMCALLCASLVVVSGSKGGVAALALGLALSVAFRRRVEWGRWILVALPLLAIGAIVVRGLVPWPLGEQSLLFRWHYLVGGFGSFTNAPWVGVGPAGFQQAFMQFRPTDSVEEVVSAHGAFADWIIAFGFAGLGLVMLQLAIAWWSAPRAPSLIGEAVEGGDSSPSRSVAEIAVASVVFASILSIAIEAPSLDSPSYVWRFGGMVVGAITAWGIAELMNAGARNVRTTVGVAMAAMGAVVLTHGQIDMVFWIPGSAMWAWIAIGVAASWNVPSDVDATGEVGATRTRWLGAISVGALTVVLGVKAIALVFVVAPALQRQDEMAIDAAQQLHEDAKAQSVEGLAHGRAKAARALADASLLWPSRSAYAVRAAEQWQAAASAEPLPNDAVQWLRLGRELVAHVPLTDSNAFAARLVGSTISIRQAEYGSGSWEAAEQSLRDLIAINPRHTESWIRLAGALLQQGDRLGASEALQTAMEVNESFAADPIRQLSGDRCERIRLQLIELRSSVGGITGEVRAHIRPKFSRR
ncbi:MAG: hypothetical protein EXS15_01165 [Phycisphaerales bacterium]|nr:hypothetical protein [Phycisphaerales bacterium]